MVIRPSLCGTCPWPPRISVTAAEPFATVRTINPSCTQVPASALAKRWLSQLGDRKFSVRQQATEKLIAAGSAILPRLRPLLESPDPEVRWRARTITEEAEGTGPERRRVAAVLGRYSHDWPMLDSLWFCEQIKQYDPEGKHDPANGRRCRELTPYLARGRVSEGYPTSWSNYREATRLWFQDMIEAGVPVMALDALWLEMHRRDRLWRSTLPPSAPGLGQVQRTP
jgi:hypothetical protein